MSDKPKVKVSLRDVRQATATALANEQITRARVDALEESLMEVSKKAREEINALNDFIDRGFWARVRWLVRGR